MAANAAACGEIKWQMRVIGNIIIRIQRDVREFLELRNAGRDKRQRRRRGEGLGGERVGVESGVSGAFTFQKRNNEGREVENVNLECDILAL